MYRPGHHNPLITPFSLQTIIDLLSTSMDLDYIF